MRILMTGVGSFTGAWFARALAVAGHDVVGACRGPLGTGDPVRLRRLAGLDRCELHGEAAFGSRPFHEILTGTAPFDVLALHGAAIDGRRDGRLDVARTVIETTHGLAAMLRGFASRGGRLVVLTGSVFEGGEGGGGADCAPLDEYGTAKTAIRERVRAACAAAGLKLARLVVPHPFGPLDKPGLVEELGRAWLAGETALIRSPTTCRDQIHVDLLARDYAAFVARSADEPGLAEAVRRPSGVVEELGEFAESLAWVMRPLLGRECLVRHGSEPAQPERRNDEACAPAHPDWDEVEALAALAADWRMRLGGESRRHVTTKSTVG